MSESMNPAMFVAVLTIVGFTLVLIDILLVPGTFLSAVGVPVILYAVFVNYRHFGLPSAMTQFVLCAAVTPFIIKWGMQRVALEQELKAEEGYRAVEDRSQFVGQLAIAETDLRPSGTILLTYQGRDEYLDCITSGDFIEKGTQVKIFSVDGPSLVVQKA